MPSAIDSLRIGIRGRFALVLSLISLFFVFAYTDFFIAWIDDLWLDQCMKGQLMSPHFSTFFMYLPGISTMIKWLYIAMPSVPWFGTFAIGISFILLVNFYYFLYPFLQTTRGVLVSCIVGVLAFILFLYSDVYLFNLTSAGLTLMGVSMINFFSAIEKSERRRLAYAFFCLSFILGSYTRYPMVLFTSGFILTGLLMYSKQIFVKRNWAYICIFLILAAVPTYNFETTTSSGFKKQHLGLLNILDSKLAQINLGQIEDPVLYAKTYALYTWFLGDEVIWEKETLDEISRIQELESNLNDIPAKIHAEFNKAQNFYQKDYCPGLNWFWRSIGFLTLVFLLLLYHIFVRKKTANETLRIHGFLVAIIVGGLAATLVYYKMEERVLHPLLVTLLLFQLFFIRKAKPDNWNQFATYILLPILLIGAGLRMAEYHSVAKFKSQEIRQKRALLEDLSNLDQVKIVMTDLYSTTLFHDKLLRNTKLPDNADYLAYKEFWGAISPKHIEQLNDICNTDAMLDFYRCLYQQRDEVVFIYFTERVKMLENYFPAVYNEQVKFHRITDFESLNVIHHSFLWMPLEFGLYTFDDSFEDAIQP